MGYEIGLDVATNIYVASSPTPFVPLRSSSPKRSRWQGRWSAGVDPWAVRNSVRDAERRRLRLLGRVLVPRSFGRRKGACITRCVKTCGVRLGKDALEDSSTTPLHRRVEVAVSFREEEGGAFA